MRDDITLAIAIAALALSAWNFWKTHWGNGPAFAIEVTHRSGASFTLWNTGRRKFLAESVSLPGARSTLPKMFELRPGRAMTFEIKLSPLDEFPETLTLWLKQWNVYATQSITAAIPFSLEAQEAARAKQDPRRHDS